MVFITASQLTLVHLLERRVARDAGVVDQHVDRADLLRDLRRAGDARVPVGDVARVRAEAVAHLVHVVEPLLRLRVARRMRGDDLVAERGELDADRFAQAAHAAGDERDARDLQWHVRSPRWLTLLRRCSVQASASGPAVHLNARARTGAARTRAVALAGLRARSGPAPRPSGGCAALPGVRGAAFIAPPRAREPAGPVRPPAARMARRRARASRPASSVTSSLVQ